MGQLIKLDNFYSSRRGGSPILDASWYFPDAYFGDLGNSDWGWKYKWPNPKYPYHLYFVNKELDNRVEKREYIEKHVNGIVMLDEFEIYVQDEWHPAGRKNQVIVRLSFEEHQDMLAFALVHGGSTEKPESYNVFK